MKNILLAALLSAFVWPGAGQIFNREFLKGFILIGLTILFGASLLLKVGLEIMKTLPPNLTSFNAAQMSVLIDEVLQRDSGYYLTFNLLLTAAWVYGVVDAYLGAREQENEKAGGNAGDAAPPEGPVR